MTRAFHLLNDARTYAALADSTRAKAKTHAEAGELALEEAARLAAERLRMYSNAMRDAAKELEARDAS